MKILIYGAGAAGCTLAVPLIKQGEDVTLIARGAHLQAMQRSGLRYTHDTGEEIIPVSAYAQEEADTRFDVIFITAKAYSLPEIAPHIPRLSHASTVIVPCCNGVPWWFLKDLQRFEGNDAIDCLDKDRALSQHLPTASLLGALFYMGATYEGPGHVSHYNRYPKIVIGEIDGSMSNRLERVGARLEQAGFRSPLTRQIRSDILIKLAWNIAFNPLSVITGMDSGQMVEDEAICVRARAVMRELKGFSDAINIPFEFDIEQHIALSHKAKRHKPSMLQDYEAGKPLEIDAILTSVLEIAGKINLELPEIQRQKNDLLVALKR